jgi:hypothetical protein
MYSGGGMLVSFVHREISSLPRVYTWMANETESTQPQSGRVQLIIYGMQVAAVNFLEITTIAGQNGAEVKGAKCRLPLMWAISGYGNVKFGLERYIRKSRSNRI